jgi:hypothetical protein
MVKRSRGPTISLMACSAFAAKASLVDVFFGVAGIAILWSRLEIFQAAVLEMALCTRHLGVLPGQLEGYAGVVEIGSIGVQPVMAGQAVVSIIPGMGLHEGRVDFDVAGAADSLVKSNVSLRVAIIAIKWRTVRVDLMSIQGISHHIVREFDGAHVCQGGISTVMLGVTVMAGQVGIDLAQHAMQRRWHQHLHGYILVADHTPVGHGGDTPEGNVAQVALCADFRMGACTSQRGTSLCIKRSGVEQHASFYHSKSCHNEDGDYDRKEPGGGDATQGRIFQQSPLYCVKN